MHKNNNQGPWSFIYKNILILIIYTDIVSRPEAVTTHQQQQLKHFIMFRFVYYHMGLQIQTVKLSIFTA